MNKKTIITLSVVAALIFVGGGVGYFAYTADQEAKKQAEDQAFREENTHVFEMGETVSLNSDEAEAGLENNFSTDLDWQGTIEATLVKATLYDSPEAAGLQSDEMPPPSEMDGEKAKYLQCELNMKNVDAIPSEYSPTNDYHMSLFKLIAADMPDRGADYPFAARYFDGTKPDAKPSEMYHFLLEQGEEKTFKLGYWVPENAADIAFTYQIGINNSSKYQINVTVEQA